MKKKKKKQKRGMSRLLGGSESDSDKTTTEKLTKESSSDRPNKSMTCKKLNNIPAGTMLMMGARCHTTAFKSCAL